MPFGSTRRKAGALAPQVEGYRAWLAERGYTTLTARNMLKDLGQVGLWLSRQGLDVADLDEGRLNQHLSDLRKLGRRRVAGPRGFVLLLMFLREAGLVPAPQVETSPADVLLERYQCWMESERGLSASTMLRYGMRTREPEVITTVSPRRITAVRGFARYLSGIDPATEVPPLGLVPYNLRRGQIFLYSNADIAAIMAAAKKRIPQPLRAATYHTLIGLLAASGLRIGEAIKLDHDDIDWAEGVLHIRESKFGKSRLVPLQDSATNALREYGRLRERLMPRPKDPAFFISLTGKRLIYACVHPVFRDLVDTAGVGRDAPHRPRLHELHRPARPPAPGQPSHHRCLPRCDPPPARLRP